LETGESPLPEYTPAPDDENTSARTPVPAPVFDADTDPVAFVLSKVLLDADGNLLHDGSGFTVVIEDDDGNQHGSYTLSANGAAVHVRGLKDAANYIIREERTEGYKAVGCSAYADGWYVGSVSGGTFSVNIPPLDRHMTIGITITNERDVQGEPGGQDEPDEQGEPEPGEVPELVISGEERSDSPFITDHVAYIIGYPDGKVHPERHVTRAEMSAVFYRLLKDDARLAYWTHENAYSDVQAAKWYNTAISVMSNMDIIKGYPDGTFLPDGDVTRAELAEIAARFAIRMDKSGYIETNFDDISGHWAADSVRYAASIGWISGYPDGSFRPDLSVSRAEFITLVNRVLGFIPETVDDLLTDDMIQWPDNENKQVWYYLAIQEATNSHESEYRVVHTPEHQSGYERWIKTTENFNWQALESVWAQQHIRRARGLG